MERIFVFYFILYLHSCRLDNQSAAVYPFLIIPLAAFLSSFSLVIYPVIIVCCALIDRNTAI